MIWHPKTHPKRISKSPRFFHWTIGSTSIVHLYTLKAHALRRRWSCNRWPLPPSLHGDKLHPDPRDPIRCRRWCTASGSRVSESRSVRFRWFENPMETYQMMGFERKVPSSMRSKMQRLAPNFFWRFKWLQLLGLLKAFSIHVGRPKGLRNHLADMDGSKLRGRSWLQHPAKSSIRWVFWGHKKQCVCEYKLSKGPKEI